MSGALKGPTATYCHTKGHVRSSHTPEAAMWHLEKYRPVCPHRTTGSQVPWQSPGTIIKGNLLTWGPRTHR